MCAERRQLYPNSAFLDGKGNSLLIRREIHSLRQNICPHAERDACRQSSAIHVLDWLQGAARMIRDQMDDLAIRVISSGRLAVQRALDPAGRVRFQQTRWQEVRQQAAQNGAIGPMSGSKRSPTTHSGAVWKSRWTWR